MFKEFALLFKLWQKKVIHILYADMDFYYLNKIKSLPFNLYKNTLVATFHHPPYELEKRIGYNKENVLASLDKIIVMGPNQIPFFKKYTKADIVFIPHGINLKYFKPNKNVNKKNTILVLGISHRDHSMNIKIIEKFKNEASVEFKIIMPQPYAKKYNHLNNVTLVTENISDDDLLAYYQSSKGVLLSLIDCTASNTLLEALACGCPLVVNNIGAVKSYIPSESGVPVFESINDSIEHIKRLLIDTEYWDRISKNQIELAKRHNWKLVAEQTEDFIFGKT